MFLVAHDDRTGKLRIGIDVLGVGLAAAALVELVMANAVDIDDPTGLVTRRTVYPHPDAAVQYVLEHIVKGEPTSYTVTDWINALREDLYGGIAQNLVADELVRQEKSLLGRAPRYAPTPQSLGEEPLAWVFGILRSGRGAGNYEQPKRVLACLCVAMDCASVITALPGDEIETAFPVVLDMCDSSYVAIVKATGYVKSKLSMAVRR
jgi:hypothetical protein